MKCFNDQLQLTVHLDEREDMLSVAKPCHRKQTNNSQCTNSVALYHSYSFS